MILSHFSHQPFELNQEHKYIGAGIYKPRGFWLSDESQQEDGWARWCIRESFHTESLRTMSDFECDLTKWVHLKTMTEMKEFNSVFRNQHARNHYFRDIDWERVRKEYAGILITPYQWEARMDHELFWYYGWDCASACVWDLSTIRPLGTKSFEVPKREDETNENP